MTTSNIIYRISIDWNKKFSSHEHLEINPDNIDILPKITTTMEYLKNPNRCIRYNVKCEAKKNHNKIELFIYYEKSQNPDIESNWGCATITIKKGAEEGDVIWKDDNNDDNNGLFKWKRVAIELTKEKRSITISRFEREQIKFRNALLQYENCCAITGETTLSSLEAAHIIPAKDGGSEITQNGLILRADIHRLYDAGEFSIDASGKIIVEAKNNLSPYYHDTLSHAKLKSETIERIKEALRYQCDRHH